MKMTPLEEYFFWEGGTESPNWILCRATFKGSFLRSKLEESYKELISRHPLLHSIVVKKPGGMFWEKKDGHIPLIDWNPVKLSNGWPACKKIDLRETPGFYLTILEEEDHTDMFFQLDHAICDGKAWELLLVELLVLYSGKQGSAGTAACHDPEKFRQRNRYGRGGSFFLNAGRTVLGASVARHFNSKKISTFLPALPRSDPEEDELLYPQLISGRLSKSDMSGLKKSALQSGVGVNDIFIAELQCAISEIRKLNGIFEAGDPTRVVVPVSLRDSSSHELSACNVISLVTLDRSDSELADEKNLSKQAHDEMTWIKDNGMNAAFLSLLWAYSLMPGGIRRFSRTQRTCRATAVLSNMLKVFSGGSCPLINAEERVEVPGAVLEDLFISGPLLSGVQILFVVYGYGQQLHVDLSYDGKTLSRSQARDLLDCFINRLRSRSITAS